MALRDGTSSETFNNLLQLNTQRTESAYKNYKINNKIICLKNQDLVKKNKMARPGTYRKCSINRSNP